MAYLFVATQATLVLVANGNPTIVGYLGAIYNGKELNRAAKVLYNSK